jgi:hypothetical protein
MSALDKDHRCRLSHTIHRVDTTIIMCIIITCIITITTLTLHLLPPSHRHRPPFRPSTHTMDHVSRHRVT